MTGRLLSLGFASICLALTAPFGEPRLLAYTAILLAAPLAAIWFSHQVGRVTSTLFWMSWAGMSPRNMRLLGWLALVATTLLYLVSLLPILFPVE